MSKTYLRPKPQPIYLEGREAKVAFIGWQKRERRRQYAKLRTACARWARLSQARKQREIRAMVEEMFEKRRDYVNWEMNRWPSRNKVGVVNEQG